MRAHLISSCWYFLPSSTDLVTVLVLRERPKSQDKFPACHCRKWWSIRAGSVFENSKLPLTQLLFVQCSCDPLKSPTICQLSVDQQLANCCWREVALHNYHGFPVIVCLFESSVLQCILSQLNEQNLMKLQEKFWRTFDQNKAHIQTKFILITVAQFWILLSFYSKQNIFLDNNILIFS